MAVPFIGAASQKRENLLNSRFCHGNALYRQGARKRYARNMLVQVAKFSAFQRQQGSALDEFQFQFRSQACELVVSRLVARANYIVTVRVANCGIAALWIFKNGETEFFQQFCNQIVQSVQACAVASTLLQRRWRWIQNNFDIDVFRHPVYECVCLRKTRSARKDESDSWIVTTSIALA